MKILEEQYLNREFIFDNLNHKLEDVFELDIGGTTGDKVTKQLLCSVPDSKLALKFSKPEKLHKIDGRVFIDRDPKTF